MSDYRRLRVPGGCYFFTVALLDRRAAALEQEAVRTALRQAITETRRAWPFTIDAWVLLPDHLHCIWTLPDGDAGYGRRWSRIKRLTSQVLDSPQWQPSSPSRIKRRESGLWQRRFWEHVIRDEQDFARHFDSVHWNPVKHGLVRRAADWPWSSFHRWVQAGVYPTNWGLSDDMEHEAAHGEPCWHP